MKPENQGTLALPPQPLAVHVLSGKYAQPGEASADDIFRRVAAGLADSEEERQDFLATMRSGAVPAGRIMATAGTKKRTTMINCFVQPIADTMIGQVNGIPGIMPAIAESAETMRLGGGVGYDFTPIRPAGAKVKGTDSRASGPVSYMRLYDRMCSTVESAGARRGAQMAVLRVDHPDIVDFITSKSLDAGETGLDSSGQATLQSLMRQQPAFGWKLRSGLCGLSNFNISVAVTDAFMEALLSDAEFDLVHEAEPSWSAPTKVMPDGVTRYVYRTVKATELWDHIMRTTYETADPGVLFIDTANRLNNLRYIETLAATNPCGEQILPPYGCCDLGHANLNRFVIGPFSENARLDKQALQNAARGMVRLLNKVLDKTNWPVPAQGAEAHNKRRIGVGFFGLANALAALGLRYGSHEAAAKAAEIQCCIRDASYLESVELAKIHGPFPLFSADEYLAEGTFASTLPQDIKDAIRAHGIRNSHLLSIAPTGTLSLAFGDNASSGIEPTFDLVTERNVRTGDGDRTERWETQDYAYRLLRSLQGDAADTSVIVTAQELSAAEHVRMVAAVAPYVDSAISKTVNVPADYPFEDFREIYLQAWRAGLKGITTYRPNTGVGAVLVAKGDTRTAGATTVATTDPDRRVELKQGPDVVAALRWPRRPNVVAEGVTYPVSFPGGKFAIVVNHWQNGHKHPLECYVAGNEQPRGLAAIAKAISVDMRADDPCWLRLKIESLLATEGPDGFDMVAPGTGKTARMGSLSAAFAAVLQHRLTEIGYLSEATEPGLMVNALFSRKEPKTGPEGALGWHVDVLNPVTGDDFLMHTKEIIMPDGKVRPYSIWLSGKYPHVLDGLTKVLSFDLRISDPGWAVMKLRKLLDFGEIRGDFMAPVPGEKAQKSYPSTVAYMAALLLARMQALGLVNEPTQDGGLADVGKGSLCAACGTMSVHRIGSCLTCTNCGASAGCG
jgi:ribonucleoside-diphosphate reductase alpha chain